MQTQKITTFLWFEGSKAEEAAKFYASVFPSATVLDVNPMTTTFELFGQRFIALNGKRGEQPFTDAVSLFVDCEDQAEVDRYWDALTKDGGKESQCGWLKDKFGVSWQIIPRALGRLISNPKALQAMLKMKKIDVATLERAAREG
ncbi:MAG: VOC family protein [Archangium sp.]|nr:VOC family protein [Archangium sp.]